jgi:hypothetical protein
MGEERVAFQSFDHGNDAIVTANSQVIALGNIMGQDDSGRLANSREHCQQNAAFERLGFIDDHKRVMQRATTDMGQRQNFN